MDSRVEFTTLSVKNECYIFTYPKSDVQQGVNYFLERTKVFLWGIALIALLYVPPRSHIYEVRAADVIVGPTADLVMPLEGVSSTPRIRE